MTEMPVNLLAYVMSNGSVNDMHPCEYSKGLLRLYGEANVGADDLKICGT